MLSDLIVKYSMVNIFLNQDRGKYAGIFDIQPSDISFLWPVMTLLCMSQIVLLHRLCYNTGLRCFSSISFSSSSHPPAFTRMMVTGYKRPLEEKDLWSLNPEDCSQRVVPQLVCRWNTECQKVKRSGAQCTMENSSFTLVFACREFSAPSSVWKFRMRRGGKFWSGTDSPLEVVSGPHYWWAVPVNG